MKRTAEWQSNLMRWQAVNYRFQLGRDIDALGLVLNSDEEVLGYVPNDEPLPIYHNIERHDNSFGEMHLSRKILAELAHGRCYYKGECGSSSLSFSSLPYRTPSSSSPYAMNCRFY